jgi:hypothetical protein
MRTGVYMVLSSKKKFTTVVVFSLLMLMTTTAVSIAQSDSDSQWINSATSYVPVLVIDIKLCQNAIDNNDMNALSTSGNKMYNDCYNGLQQSNSIQVTIQIQSIKQLYNTCLTHCMNAGYDFHNNDPSSGVSEMNQGKASLDQLKQALQHI